MCGSVFNAISRTPRDLEPEIEVHSWAKGEEEEQVKKIEPPEMTEEAREFLMNFGLL